MKMRKTKLLEAAAAAGLAFTLFGNSSTRATTLTWDPAQNGAGGSGTWSTTSTDHFWFDGTSDVAWTDGNSPTFAHISGTGTLGSDISAGTLTCGIANYAVDLNSHNLTASALASSSCSGYASADSRSFSSASH